MILDYKTWLTNRANGHLAAGQEIPDDLFMEMIGQGIDVAAIEKKYLVDSLSESAHRND